MVHCTEMVNEGGAVEAMQVLPGSAVMDRVLGNLGLFLPSYGKPNSLDQGKDSGVTCSGRLGLTHTHAPGKGCDSPRALVSLTRGLPHHLPLPHRFGT